MAISLTLGASAATASAAGGGPDNSVTATTTAGHSSEALSSLQLARYAGNDLESTNSARSDAHDCTGCRSIAVAVQAVLATGHPSTVAPHNFSVATTESCTRCVSFTFAYQYVVVTPTRVSLARDGRRQIAHIRAEIAAAVADSTLSAPDLDTRLHQLATQFRGVVDEQLSDARVRHHGSVRQHEDSTPPQPSSSGP